MRRLILIAYCLGCIFEAPLLSNVAPAAVELLAMPPLRPCLGTQGAFRHVQCGSATRKYRNRLEASTKVVRESTIASLPGNVIKGSVNSLLHTSLEGAIFSAVLIGGPGEQKEQLDGCQNHRVPRFLQDS